MKPKSNSSKASRPAPPPPSRRFQPFLPPETMASIRTIIDDIARDGEPFENADMVTEIIVTALKAVQSRIGRGDLKLLSRSLRELRYAFKIFKNYRGVRKVTIFGSARTKPSSPEYKMTKRFSELITRNGYMIITGAGPGVMQAGNEGAGVGNSFGVNIRLPFEQSANEFIASEPTYIDCRYFFTRKLVFVKEASAAAFFPGGFGTLDEAFEILTLVQTGKCDPIPVVLVDRKGGRYWKSLDALIRKSLLGEGKISPEDLSLYKIFESPAEAVKEILRFYSNYHSLRYVGAKLVLRLQRRLDRTALRRVNDRFSDILSSGRFEMSDALPEEENQPELARLPRLVFHFNRVNNGRLRQLIDELNRA